MPALLVGGVLLVLIGGFGFTRAEQAAAPAGQAADPPRQQSSGKMTLRAVAAATNQPVEGVSIEYYSRFDGKYKEGTVATGKDGLATIDYPPNSRIESFQIIARKARLVPIDIVWTNQSHPVALPTLKELRFDPGTTIGGIVRDEAGHPIAGARVDVVGSATESESTNYGFSLATTETDAQGRWRLDIAPSSLSGIGFNVEHPRYRRNGIVANRNLDGVIVLTKGLTVTGRVVNAAGRPIKGARAMLGPDRFGTNPPSGTTDDRGEFTLENCEPGPSIVTVQAEGYAPRFRDVRVEAGAAPVVITLPEPGATLRVKVVNVEGKPVAGAILGVDTWRGHRSLEFRKEAGADGRIEWRRRPEDVMLCDVFKPGYMSSREVALTASDREHVVTLYPELVISGRVTDAETGRPLPNVPPDPGPEVQAMEGDPLGRERGGGARGRAIHDPVRRAVRSLLRPGRCPGLPAGSTRAPSSRPTRVRHSTSPSGAAGDCPRSSSAPTASPPRGPRSCSRRSEWVT